MKLPLQISFHGMEPSEALEAAAAKKAHKLEEFCSDIMSCRVIIEQLQKHQHQGRPFAVRIDLRLPSRELCVNHVQDEDAYVALRDAFDDMKRQLEDAVRRLRGQEKQHPVALPGEVVRLDTEGRFGFIGTPDGDEYYFGRENLSDATFARRPPTCGSRRTCRPATRRARRSRGMASATSWAAGWRA